MHAVDVDLQAVIVDDKGVRVSDSGRPALAASAVCFAMGQVIIDAAYYNNMKALRRLNGEPGQMQWTQLRVIFSRCVTHSGDEQTGEKTGMDETIWVMRPARKPEVRRL